MNILLVKGQTQYGALNHFLDQLGTAFEKMGHKVLECYFRDASKEEFILLKRTHIDMAITMNGMCAGILQEYINCQECLVWNFFVDHPVYHGKRLTEQWYRQVSSFIDRNHQRYANTYFKNLDHTYFLPHGGSGKVMENTYKNRSNDVVFFGTYTDILELSKNFLNYNDAMQQVLFTVAEKLSLGQGTLEDLFLEELNQCGVAISESEAIGLIEEIEFVDRYVRNFNRIEMLEAMAKNEVQVEVFGAGWDKYENQYPDYLHIHSEVSFDETLEIMSDAKIVLNNLPLFRNGSHERIFNTMLSGAVCISEKNDYLEEEFIENKEIVFFEFNDLAALPEKVKILLEDQALAEEIAQSGLIKAKGSHTWEHRAKTMLEYYEQSLFEKSNRCVTEVEDIDWRFNQLVQFIENNSEKQIFEKMKGTYLGLDRFNYALRERMEESYRNYPYWGKLSLKNGEFELISQRAYHLKNHRDDFIWLYQKLKDDTSRKILTNILYHWVTFKREYLSKITQSEVEQYFDHDIISGDREEVFVDIGAYNGDTLLSYLSNYMQYKKVICYELDPNNYNELVKVAERFDNVEARNNAVGLNHGEMIAVNIQEERSVSSRVDVSGSMNSKSERMIKMVSLDEDILEKITFLKMDVEGAERYILQGAKRHIQNDRPKLAICIYHGNEDLWKIGRIINELNDSYEFYIRYYGGNLYPNEIVLYCV